MFFITIISALIAIIFLILSCHLCRKICQEIEPPPPYRTPLPSLPHRDPIPPPLAPMPALPSLPSGAIPVGLEPPPYSEVTAKPFLYPLPRGPCPECGRSPEPHFATRNSF